MTHTIRAFLAVGLIAASLSAQCTIGAPFDNNTSTLGQVELNINAGADSTNNSLFTPLAQDNVASASTGEAISFNVSNPAGTAGNAVSIYFSIGGPGAPLPVPGLGDLYLNLAAPLAMVDGAGFLGPATPFSTHPGPSAFYSLFMAVPLNPALNNNCYTFQAIVIDPAFPGGIRLGNASALQLRASVSSVLGSNFGSEGSGFAIATTGSGNGIAHFDGFDPSNSASLPDSVSGALAANSGTVPTGAQSGAIRYEDAGSPGVVATSSGENMNSFFAVVDPFGVSSNAAVGILPLNVSPFNPNESWATVTQVLAGSGTVDTWSFTANSGDIVVVECYSLDTTQSRILDGAGAAFTPNATQGFDPLLNLAHGTNVEPLTFDGGSIAPLVVQGDDDSGPGFNARMVFQVRNTDTMQVLVGTSFPGTFVTGDYMLNIRVLAGEPSVASFSIGGQTTANIGGFGEIVTINGAGIQAGFIYDVTLTPIHGLYPPVVIQNNASTTPGQVAFTLPPQTVGSFDIGSHIVTITDATGTNGTSIAWDNSFFNQPLGPLPDILLVTSTALTGLAGNGPINPSTTYVSGPVVGPGGYWSFSNDSFGALITPGRTIYAEMVGVDTTSNNRLMDGVAAESNPTLGVFNPMMTLFGPGLFPQLASNDDDGVDPFAFNWPNSGAAGIGQGAALLANAPFAGGTGYTLFTWENICWVSCAQAKTGIISVVVY